MCCAEHDTRLDRNRSVSQLATWPLGSQPTSPIRRCRCSFIIIWANQGLGSSSSDSVWYDTVWYRMILFIKQWASDWNWGQVILNHFRSGTLPDPIVSVVHVVSYRPQRPFRSSQHVARNHLSLCVINVIFFHYKNKKIQYDIRRLSHRQGCASGSARNAGALHV